MNALRKLIKERCLSNKGLSMVEVMVSVAILAIVALPLLNMFANSTALVVKTNKKAQETYVAKAQIESLYNKSMVQLVNTALASTTLTAGKPTLDASGNQVKTPIADTLMTGSGKYVTVSATPTGNLDATQSAAYPNPVYAYLIVTKNNSFNAKFIGPEGLISDIPDVSKLDNAVFTATKAGSAYTLKTSGGASLLSAPSGVKPAGRPMVLVINSVAVVNPGTDNTFSFFVAGDLCVQHYKPVSMLVGGYRNNFVVAKKNSGDAIPISVYSNDNTTPTAIPFTVTCAVYPTATTPIASPESTTQDTLEVFIGT